MVSRAVVPPSAPPPPDEGYGSGSSSSSTDNRGTVRPHSVSPFLRNIRRRLENGGNEEEDVDLETVSCLLNFSTRERGGVRPQTPSQSVVTSVASFKIEGSSGSEETSVMVRTFTTSPPTTPTAAPRPLRPPPIITSQMRHTCHPCIRPRAVRRNAPPAAALGAPPTQEEDDSLELPDLPETPASPDTSDITVIRLVKNFFGGNKIMLLKKILFLCYL